MGVLQFGQRYGKSELEAACAKAVKIGSVTYTTIKRLMTGTLDPAPDNTPTPPHENLRNPAEFR
jgi:hypothetical protein